METRTIEIITDKAEIRPEDSYRIRITIMADGEELQDILSSIGEGAILRYMEENGYEVSGKAYN